MAKGSKALEMLEARVEELEDALETAKSEAEYNSDVERWWWCRHRENWPERGLPVPRLELVWTKTGETWRNREALYVMVYRHRLDHLEAVPMGRTKVDGGLGEPPVRNGVVDTPFRDGVHLRSDARHLGLPAFAIVVNDDGVMTDCSPIKPLAPGE